MATVHIQRFFLKKNYGQILHEKDYNKIIKKFKKIKRNYGNI